MSRIVYGISQNEISELKAFGINPRVLEKLDSSQTLDLYRTISCIWAAIKNAETPSRSYK